MVAVPHRSEATEKPVTHQNISARRPNRFASHPAAGVPTAVVAALAVFGYLLGPLGQLAASNTPHDHE